MFPCPAWCWLKVFSNVSKVAAAIQGSGSIPARGDVSRGLGSAGRLGALWGRLVHAFETHGDPLTFPYSAQGVVREVPAVGLMGPSAKSP